jgi:hypothetical protein
MRIKRGRNQAQKIRTDKIYCRQGMFSKFKGPVSKRSIKPVSASSQQLNRLCLDELHNLANWGTVKPILRI